MTMKQSAHLHCDPFALSLSKGKRRPFILRQAQDELTQDTEELKSRLLRRAPRNDSRLCVFNTPLIYIRMAQQS